MPLQQAQLGQLPYMNLARYVPERPPIEPAWHKALTAFLVNTAGSAGKDLVGNAMAPDYSAQARALGLPGAPTTDPSFASKVLHGPGWDRQALQEGIREKNAETRAGEMEKHADLQDKMLQERLGLSREEMQALNDYRSKELAQRAQEQGFREEESRRTADYRNQSLGLERDRLSADTANRQAQLSAEVQHWKDQVDPSSPLVASEVGLRNAERQRYINEADPTWQGRVKASEMLEMLRMTNPDMYNKLVAGTAPTSSNDAINPHMTGSQSVPGGNPGEPTAVPVPTATTPQTTQSVSPADLLNARESANRGTAAGTPGQAGQMTPLPDMPGHDEAPGGLTQPQALNQHVGEAFGPSDLLSLVRPPQTPNSPTAIQAPTASQTSLPITLDPQTMKVAADYLRKLMMPGQSGVAMQAANGGIPMWSV